MTRKIDFGQRRFTTAGQWSRTHWAQLGAVRLRRHAAGQAAGRAAGPAPVQPPPCGRCRGAAHCSGGAQRLPPPPFPPLTRRPAAPASDQAAWPGQGCLHARTLSAPRICRWMTSWGAFALGPVVNRLARSLFRADFAVHGGATRTADSCPVRSSSIEIGSVGACCV